MSLEKVLQKHVLALLHSELWCTPVEPQTDAIQGHSFLERAAGPAWSPAHNRRGCGSAP